jgi:3-(3-hydroxy-phenyl)propionate hydroxylase
VSTNSAPTTVASHRSPSGQPVLIVGAGPVGLTTALGLAQRDVPVIVIEHEPALTTDLRAGSFHPPTLEALAVLGITEKFLQIGIRVPRWQIRDRRTGVVAEFDLGLIADVTPYPYRFHCEQFKLTPLLLEALLKHPHASVRFSTTFETLRQTDDEVIATVSGPGGRDDIHAAYLVGADGGRSAVRKAVDVDFPGYTWPERFLVVGTRVDLATFGFTPNAYIADPVEFSAIFKMPYDGPGGMWRVLFPTDANLPEEQVLTPENVERLMQGLLPRPTPYEVEHKGTYRVHQRVAETFRAGRVLLAGDAAHLNNPLGAMGLNSGLHDAANLYPKLAAVMREESDPAILDVYARQRRTITIDFVQEISTRNKRLLEERDPSVRAERLDEIRRIGADPKRAREFLLKSSMIESIRRAATIQ